MIRSSVRQWLRGDNDPAYHRAIARATALFWMAVLETDPDAGTALAEASQHSSFMAVGRLESKTSSLPRYE